MNKTTPFFSTTPETVRNDQSLSKEAKSLFGAILPLTLNDKGYCFANNEFFSAALSLSVSDIKVLFNELIDSNYIEERELVETYITHTKSMRRITIKLDNFSETDADNPIIGLLTHQKIVLSTPKYLCDNYTKIINSLLKELCGGLNNEVV